jgi:hypothetical protein
MQQDIHTTLSRRAFLSSQTTGLGGLTTTWGLAQPLSSFDDGKE